MVEAVGATAPAVVLMEAGVDTEVGEGTEVGDGAVAGEATAWATSAVACARLTGARSD
jgi:hypothetical protein